MVTMGMGAMAGAIAEHAAEIRLHSQGIRTRSIEYACGAGHVATAMCVCVPKEMLPADIEQKINAENMTGHGPWWKVSPDKTCPCGDQPDRLHYLLMQA